MSESHLNFTRSQPAFHLVFNWPRFLFLYGYCWRWVRLQWPIMIPVRCTAWANNSVPPSTRCQNLSMCQRNVCDFTLVPRAFKLGSQSVERIGIDNPWTSWANFLINLNGLWAPWLNASESWSAWSLVTVTILILQGMYLHAQGFTDSCQDSWCIRNKEMIRIRRIATYECISAVRSFVSCGKYPLTDSDYF
jgi:hypothetical protein